MRRKIAWLALILLLPPLSVEGAVTAQEEHDHAIALAHYQGELGCATAAEIRLIGSSNSLSISEQFHILALADYWARRILVSGQKAGYSPDHIINTLHGFIADFLSDLKSPDGATVSKLMDQVTVAAKACAIDPSGQSITVAPNKP